MQKLSRKSSTQLPHQDDPPPTADGSMSGSAGSNNPAIDSAKPLCTIPVGFGYKLILESRFLKFNLLSIWLYIFAGYTANEWMYLLSSAFFVASLLGLILPFLQLWDVEAICSMPDEVLVSECADVKIALRRTMQLGMISAILPLQSVRMSIQLLRRSVSKDHEHVVPPDPVLIDHIYGEFWFEFPTHALRRGVYYLKGVELLSSFPLGLAWWSRTVSLKKDDAEPKITVLPLVIPISGNFLFKIGGVNSLMGISSVSSVVTTQSTSVRGVREFKNGDSLRHIHWASTARVGKLLVREFESEVLPVFDLFLDLTANWRDQEQFELAVLLFHSLAHLGYGMGSLPQLTLNPALESATVASLMSDLPQIPTSVGWISQVLARVEPITLSDLPREERQESDLSTALVGPAERPLLCIQPLHEGLIKSSSKRGDHIVYPIKLCVADRASISDVSSTSALENRPSGSSEATVIAVLHSENDIEAL